MAVLLVYPTIGATNQAPTAISLSNSSIMDNAADGDVVGTITVTDADSAGLNSLTCSNNKFKVVYTSGLTGSLQRSATGTLTAGVSETLTITATDSSGNPFTSGTQTITVNDHTAETLISIIAITNPTGTTATNEPFTIGFPLSPTALGSNNITVYDDNGSGGKGTILSAYQWKLQSTDMHSKVRLGRISGVVPSLAGSATRKLHVYASPTSLPSGTDITAAAVLATSIQFQAEYDIGGTTYTADVRSCLASTTFSKTAAWHSVFFTGPFEACIICHMPPANGGTAHASGDGLHTEFHLYVSAVGGTIVRAVCDVVTTNSDVARASAVHYYYGLTVKRATSIGDGTLISTDDTDPDGNVIRYAYARSQPAATLTATGATSTGAKTWTTSGTWAADIIGAHITSADGAAYVTGRTNSTTITVYVYDAFGAESYTSGNWTIEGVGHAYNTVYRLRSYVGSKPCVLAWGDNGSAITPTTRAPLAYATSTKLLMNHQQTYAGTTHSMTALNLMRGDSTRRPLTLLGPESLNMGDVETDVGQTGGRDDIGMLPAWSVYGLAKYDANGRRKIFENAEYWATCEWMSPRRWSGSPSAGALPSAPRIDCGTDFNWHGGSGTRIAGYDQAATFWPYDRDGAHQSASLYVPYLLTCDYFWLERLQAQLTENAFLSLLQVYHGSGIDGTVFGAVTGTGNQQTQFGNIQERAQGWITRNLVQTAICTPDTDNSRLFQEKSHYTTRCAKFWDAAVRFSTTDVNSYWTSTPKEPPYTAEVTLPQGADYWTRWFQNEYLAWVLGHVKEVGMDDADFDTFAEWYLRIITGPVAHSDVFVADYMTNAYSWLLVDSVYGDGTRPQTWAELYKRNALFHPQDMGDYGVNLRVPTGTLTISPNTVGSGRTFTFSNSYFGQGSWYVGGLIAQPSTGGLAKITSISGSVATCEILTVFSSTTPTISTIVLPWPHPLDYSGAQSSVSNESSYAQLYKCACVSALICGATGAQDAYDYAIARTGYVEANDFHHIAPR